MLYTPIESRSRCYREEKALFRVERGQETEGTREEQQKRSAHPRLSLSLWDDDPAYGVLGVGVLI